MSPRAATVDKATTTPAGPTVPAGEPRPGPLTPPTQPSPPSEPTAPAPPTPAPEREAALAEVRRLIVTGDLGLAQLVGPLALDPAALRDEALDVLAEAGLADEPVRDDHPLTVWEAIAEVTRRIGAVRKTGRADPKVGGYRFRGIDDVLAALHPILGDVGLVLMPGQIVEHRREVRSTSGSSLNVTILTVRYTLVGPDGSQLVGEAVGEGADAGDKGSGKAMSQAYKSFAFQTFSIPTEDSAADEPDLDNPPARPFSDRERERAKAAHTAGQQADGMPALVAVRHAAVAEGLLDVPVGTVDGDVPLGVLLDRRRTEVERAAARAAQAPA